MNHNELPEKPLFTDDNEDCGNFSDQDLSLEELKEKAAINRQGKTLDFCLSSAKWIAPIAFILIAADLLLQHLKMDSSLLKDCFSLLTYVVTAALGFIFANNSK